MQPITHEVNHFFQPTNHSCGQTSTAMMLSSLGQTVSAHEVVQSVPVLSVGNIENWGTLAPSLATWVLGRGYAVEMHTADFQLIDLEWSTLERDALLKRMRLALGVRTVPALGEELSRVFLQTYIDFLEAGGDLHIYPHMSSDLLNRLLSEGPVFININPNVLYNHGRSQNIGLRQSVPDDLHGYIDTHFVVLYGTDGAGQYLLADPWYEPGRHEVDSERLLCAMTAGQIQCENTIFQIKPRRHN